jgi:hypothetical protein
MEKLQKSMTVYVKSLSKRNEAEDKEKILPVGYLGQTMIHHGEDFEPDSEFGNCLISSYILPPWRSDMLISMQVWAERTIELQEFRRVTLQMLRQGGSSHWNDHWP